MLLSPSYLSMKTTVSRLYTCMLDISEEVKNAAVAAPVAITVGGKLKQL